MILSDLVVESTLRQPKALAVRAPDQELTYDALNCLANQIARALAKLGVQRGSRVGIWLDKSARTVALMQGILRLGAAYVPIDPLSPVARAQMIIRDCQLCALIASKEKSEQVLKDDLADVSCLTVDQPWRGLSWQDLSSFSSELFEQPSQHPDELAYILYTSGSTGKPKGVCISHRNALVVCHEIIEG